MIIGRGALIFLVIVSSNLKQIKSEQPLGCLKPVKPVSTTPKPPNPDPPNNDPPPHSDDDTPIDNCPFRKYVTDKNGRPVPSLTGTLRAGQNGPILLSDATFVNHMAQFDRERIPERVVHAKGVGAHGVFEVTRDITRYCKSKVFSQIGKTTKIFARFSGTMGAKGGADTRIDGRGFSIKFYTEEGNWDLTTLSVPVFSIREPMWFPSMVRSNKKDPVTNHDNPNMRWDYRTYTPIQMNFLLHVYSDLGLPDGFRHMHTWSINTFKFVNKTDNVVYVRFHLESQQGQKNLTLDEATKLAGHNADYFTQDLNVAIKSKDYPKWNLMVQIMEVDQTKNFKWNPFDTTIEWPVNEFPYILIGVCTFNRNPKDHFSEVELSAFSPSNLIPGIEVSPDPLLQGRFFSYPDAQRHRLGPNFQDYEINRPLGEIVSYDQDGTNPAADHSGRPRQSFPSSWDCTQIDENAKESEYEVSGPVRRPDYTDEDYYSQAKMFLDTLSPGERSRLTMTLAIDLSAVNGSIREKVYAQFAQVDRTLVQDIQGHMKNKSRILGRYAGHV